MFKESQATKDIIDLNVEFMLGENPTTALEKLRLEGNTATVCGKVFKNGEPTYSCRECGVDPTCVLCVNCFKRSPHRFHKYKMSSSGGGGCCDCGDDEAWKRDHYCELHLVCLFVLNSCRLFDLFELFVHSFILGESQESAGKQNHHERSAGTLRDLL